MTTTNMTFLTPSVLQFAQGEQTGCLVEHCCCVVVGTIEWINKSRTEDVVQIDMGYIGCVRGEW